VAATAALVRAGRGKAPFPGGRLAGPGESDRIGIADSATIVLGLQDEIRRSEESRYDHRLHGVLLVAQGMTEEMGWAGLREGERSGRGPGD
jgi:hypothetical protein